jgi:hypothetical protein
MRGKSPETESEVSVTAQMPVATFHTSVSTAAGSGDGLEAKLSALVSVLVAKGVITDAELADALKKLKP